jgi:hypothetical protein
VPHDFFAQPGNERRGPRANLTGANLTGANVANADLTGALWSETTQWPEPVAAEMVDRSEEVRPGGLVGYRLG